MGKKKAETKQTQSFNNTNSYGFMTPPDTGDIAALRDFKFNVDPSVGYAYGSAKNQIANTFNNPAGGNYTPQMRDAILRSQYAQLAQGEAGARSEAAQALQGQQFGQRAAVAGLTAPRMVQTGSSGTGQSQGMTQQSGNLVESLISGGATVAAA